MNDTFCWRFFEIVMSLSIMVIIIIITTFLTNYISGSIEVLYFCQVHCVKCQCSVCLRMGFLEERRRRGVVWWERDALAGFPVTFEFSRECLGFPEFEWLLIVPERQAGFDAGGEEARILQGVQ